MEFIKLEDFKPKDINLSDDASHIQDGFGRIETWYYDAIFENNYSIVTLINIIKIGRFGRVLTGLFIYKNSKPIIIIRKRYPIKHLNIRSDKPSIKINDIELLKGYIDDKNEWITHLERDEDSIRVDLDFIKKSKGFKGETFLGKWLVIPKMDVIGNIQIDSKVIELKGFGYHDHNIYPIYAPFKTKGYYFGKLDIDENNHLTWASVIKNRKKQQLLAILSKNNQYYNIPMNSVQYKILENIVNHGKTIPVKCSLNINSDIVHLELNIESSNYHYIGILATNYWRYHVIYTGKVKIGSKKYYINKNEITEYLRFF